MPTTKTFLTASLACSFLAPALLNAAPFTAGNIAIYRVGNGTGTLSGASAPVFVDEYTSTGTLVQSFALPTSAGGGQFALTDSGSASSNGNMTLALDSSALVLTGYNAGTGVASITSTSTTGGSAVLRTIGLITVAGTIDTSTTTTAFSGNNIRSATSTNGTDLWAVGGNGGVVYTTKGASGAGTVVANNSTNNRYLNITSGQLYSSSGSGTNTFRGESTVGTGLPTTTGSTITRLPGLTDGTNNNNYAFFFADLSAGVAGVDTLYVADQTAGLEKFSLVGGNWTSNGSLLAPNIGAGNAGLIGLAGNVTGSGVSLFLTGSGTSGTAGALFGFNDTTGYNALLSGSITTLVTADANTAFRGVAFTPGTSVSIVPEPSTFASLLGGVGLLLGWRRRRQA
jgi:hypothetical protein